MRKPGVLNPDGSGEPSEPVRSALVDAKPYCRASRLFGTATAYMLTLNTHLFKRLFLQKATKLVNKEGGRTGKV
jgi:hypothetical protein